MTLSCSGRAMTYVWNRVDAWPAREADRSPRHTNRMFQACSVMPGTGSPLLFTSRTAPLFNTAKLHNFIGQATLRSLQQQPTTSNRG